MTTIAGMPFAELPVDRDGRRERPDEALVPAGITDLIVLSHGWKNSREDALALYRGILEGARAAADGTMDADGRRFAAIGVLWPAFRFEPDLSLVRDDLGTGGGGGAASLEASGIDEGDVRAYAARVAGSLGEDPVVFADAALAAAGGGAAADAFMKHLRTAVAVDVPMDLRAEHRELLRAPGGELVERLSQGADLDTEGPDGDGRGAAAGLGSSIARRGWRLLAGGKAAVATILNQATYYEMKARAGAVGAAVAALLDAEVPDGVRVHLVGHSFGGRLVTAACAALRKVSPRSLSLLQAAYSHNGLGTGVGPLAVDGGFRSVVTGRRVSGPILVTHTRRDTAVGFFYAVASTASGEIAQGTGVVQRLIGGPDDLHGGMGANGAQAMLDGEAVEHVATAGSAPDLVDGKVNNVLADAIILEHNDVANANVGHLVWRAMS